MRSLEYSWLASLENSIHTFVIESAASAMIVRNMIGPKIEVHRAIVVGRSLDFDQLPAGVNPLLAVRRISELDQATGNMVVVGKRIHAVR